MWSHFGAYLNGNGLSHLRSYEAWKRVCHICNSHEHSCEFRCNVQLVGVSTYHHQWCKHHSQTEKEHCCCRGCTQVATDEKESGTSSKGCRWEVYADAVRVTNSGGVCPVASFLPTFPNPSPYFHLHVERAWEQDYIPSMYSFNEQHWMQPRKNCDQCLKQSKNEAKTKEFVI